MCNRHIIELDYSSDLCCHDCGARGFIRYVLVLACDDVVCVFCKDTHLKQCPFVPK